MLDYKSTQISRRQAKVVTTTKDAIGSVSPDRLLQTSQNISRIGKCGACGVTLGSDRCPQLLPCLHSVCKVCLPQSAGDALGVCPACDSSYILLDVKKNPFFKETPNISGLQAASKCGGCDETAVSGWCVECGEALCVACVSAHRRVRVTRDHTILTQQKLPTGSVPITFCLTHKEEPMKLYCLSCDQQTCRDCQLTYHRNHRFQFLQEVVADLKQDIKSLMMRVGHQKESVKQSLLGLDERLLDLTDLQAKVKVELRELILSIRNALVKHAVKMVMEMQEQCRCESVNIFERKEMLRKLQERQEYMLAFAEQTLHIDDHVALLACKAQIQKQLHHVLSQTTQLPPSMLDVKLQSNQDVWENITCFGKLLMTEVPFAISVRTTTRKDPDSPLQAQSASPQKCPGSSTSPGQPSREQSSDKVGLVLPVKAVADSPCERQPPAAVEPLAKPAVAITENEPSSTVTETVELVSVNGPKVQDLANNVDKRQSTACVTPIITTMKHMGSAETVCHDLVHETSVVTTAFLDTCTVDDFSRGTTTNETDMVKGCRKTTPTVEDMDQSKAISKPTGMATINADLTMTVVNNDIHTSSTKEGEMEKNTDSVKTVTAPTDTTVASQCLSQPMELTLKKDYSLISLEKCNSVQNDEPQIKSNGWLSSPESLDNCSENPFQAGTSSEEPMQIQSEISTSSKNVSARNTEDDKMGDTHFDCPTEDQNGTSAVKTVDTRSARDSRSSISRSLLPRVSLFKIPVPVPGPGHPLPQFRLIPGTSKHEILLQTVEEQDEFAVSLDSASKSVSKTVLRLPKKACCAACRVSGKLFQCVVCSRTFHRDCHIPPISVSISKWQCMLCRDLTDVGDEYCKTADGSECLNVLEQRKCEHVLLLLTCSKYSSALYQRVQLPSQSSRYVDITLIRGRLLRKLVPSYRTPSEFVSDIWLLLDCLRNSKESSKVMKLQKCFQRMLGNIFGMTIDPSLLERPFGKEQERRPGSVEKETLKRARRSPRVPAKKLHQDTSA